MESLSLSHTHTDTHTHIHTHTHTHQTARQLRRGNTVISIMVADLRLYYKVSVLKQYGTGT